MIVGYNYGRGPVRDRIGEHFARVDLRAIDKSHGDDTRLDDLIYAVQRDTEEVLLLTIGVVIYGSIRKHRILECGWSTSSRTSWSGR